MGMYDSVYFGGGNTRLPAPLTPELLEDEWQTKELYDSLYVFVIKDDQLFYREGDEARTLHRLPYTGTFEIHNWLPVQEELVALLVRVQDGAVVEISVPEDSRHTGMPYIEAMNRDRNREFTYSDNLTRTLQEWDAKRSPWERFRRNLRSAGWEFRQAREYFVSGIKKLFGARS